MQNLLFETHLTGITFYFMLLLPEMYKVNLVSKLRKCLQALTSLVLGLNLFLQSPGKAPEKTIDQRAKAVREAILKTPSGQDLLQKSGPEKNNGASELAQWGNWLNWNNWNNWNNWANWINWRNF